jgi:DNA repair protein RadC
MMEIKGHKRTALNSSAAVADVFKAILKAEPEYEQEKEHFWSVGVDAKNRIKYIDLVSLGTLTNSLIHPRETFRFAVMSGVCAIIVVHNHPSGDPTPSRDDIAVTERLKQAGDVLGIPLLDHVIVGNGDDAGYVSLKEKGIV